MRYTLKVSRNENLQQIETQEQSRFIKSIIEALEIPIEWNTDEPLSVDTKIRLRKEFENYKINIIKNENGDIKFYIEDEVVAEWKKPNIKLVENPSKTKITEKLFYELEINFWTTFDNEDI